MQKLIAILALSIAAIYAAEQPRDNYYRIFVQIESDKDANRQFNGAMNLIARRYFNAQAHTRKHISLINARVREDIKNEAYQFFKKYLYQHQAQLHGALNFETFKKLSDFQTVVFSLTPGLRELYNDFASPLLGMILEKFPDASTQTDDRGNKGFWHTVYDGSGKLIAEYIVDFLPHVSILKTDEDKSAQLNGEILNRKLFVPPFYYKPDNVIVSEPQLMPDTSMLKINRAGVNGSPIASTPRRQPVQQAPAALPLQQQAQDLMNQYSAAYSSGQFEQAERVLQSLTDVVRQLSSQSQPAASSAQPPAAAKTPNAQELVTKLIAQLFDLSSMVDAGNRPAIRAALNSIALTLPSEFPISVAEVKQHEMFAQEYKAGYLSAIIKKVETLSTADVDRMNLQELKERIASLINFLLEEESYRVT